MNMKKYLRLYRSFFIASLKADLEYRMNFVSRVATDIFWYAAQVLTFEALYRHTPKIGDWNHEQARVFLGVMFVVDALYMVILSENLDRLNDRVRKGDMDLLLAKPVNSQFMMSCQRAVTAILGNLIIAVSWLTWSIINLPDFQWFRIFWLLVFIPCSLLVLYSVRFMFATTAVIWTRSENLQYIWYQLYRLGLRPDSLYPPWLRFIVLTVLPVGMVASIPTRFLIEEPNWGLFIWTLLLAFSFFYASQRFWRYSLRHYTSASS